MVSTNLNFKRLENPINPENPASATREGKTEVCFLVEMRKGKGREGQVGSWALACLLGMSKNIFSLPLTQHTSLWDTYEIVLPQVVVWNILLMEASETVGGLDAVPQIGKRCSRSHISGHKQQAGS